MSVTNDELRAAMLAFHATSRKIPMTDDWALANMDEPQRMRAAIEAAKATAMAPVVSEKTGEYPATPATNAT